MKRALRRVGRALGRIPHPPLRSRRGLFVIIVFAGALGSAVALGSVVAVQWTETPDFCGRCHTMGPELKAFEASPHRELACAECHVKPGLGGWVEAKIKGTKQLFEIVTGSFPRPIPPPSHADLPPVTDTCLRCHSLESITRNGGPIRMIMRTRFQEDERNTKETVAVVIRPAGLGGTSGIRGVHWHVEQRVDFIASGERAQTIDWVGVTAADGTIEQYVSRSAVGVSTDVTPDIERLTHTQQSRRMDCLDCHNRVGHGVKTPSQALDQSIDAGRIDQSLPYVKREGLRLLTGDYASLADADRAVTTLRGFYQAQYPLVLDLQAPAIAAAIGELQALYRDVATPEMRVSATTYPNNLGHQTSPGCFRCHDGAHYKVEGGKLTGETIPSACATCHTFPEVGASVSGLLLGGEPETHKDKLWVFGHKASATALDPAGTTCGACHTRTYCENCHKTGAITVNHDEMLFNHPAAIQKSGVGSCAYCHQPVYCARCHREPVLRTSP